jgi:hypothetical protein
MSSPYYVPSIFFCILSFITPKKAYELHISNPQSHFTNSETQSLHNLPKALQLLGSKGGI